MAEDKTYSELSKLAERIKDTTESIEKEAEQMEDAFGNISTMGEITGDSLATMTAKLKEYQSSIVSNAKVMNLTTAQQEKFRNESLEATRSLLTLNDELSKGGGISKNSFATMQSAMQVVTSGITSFTGELNKSERDLEKRKKEEGAAGAGMIQRKLEESRTEYLEKLEAAYAEGGMMKTSFALIGKKLGDIVPGLSPMLEVIKNSLLFQTTKQLMLPYWIRYKEWKFRRKLQKAQQRFFNRGGDPENRFFDLRDRMLGALSKLGWGVGETFEAIRDVREKGLGIKDWHKLGERPFDSEQAKQLKEFVEKQQDLNDITIERRYDDIAAREEQKELLENQIAATVTIGEDGKEKWPLESIKKFHEELVPLHKQDVRDQEEILRLQESKLRMDSTEEIERALQKGNEKGAFGDIEVRFKDLIAINKENAAEILTQAELTRKQDMELHSGSPPYASALPDILIQSKKQTAALEQDEAVKSKIGNAFGEMKGRLSGMMSGAVGFLKGIATAVRGLRRRVGKALVGLGMGLMTMFKAIGSITKKELFIGLAAITGLSLNMVLLAKAVSIVAPALVKIFGGLSKIIGAFAGAIQKIGGVIVGIGKVVIEFMGTFVQSIIDLSKVPFWSFVKISAGFAMLGVSLLAFSASAIIGGIRALTALGKASTGLAALAMAMDDPERLAAGFDILAKSVARFDKSAENITPGMTTSLQSILNTPGGQVALMQGAGSNKLVALSNANTTLTNEQLGMGGNVTIVNSAVANTEGNSVAIQRSPHDDTLTQSTNTVPR